MVPKPDQALLKNPLLLPVKLGGMPQQRLVTFAMMQLVNQKFTGEVGAAMETRYLLVQKVTFWASIVPYCASATLVWTLANKALRREMEPLSMEIPLPHFTNCALRKVTATVFNAMPHCA